MRFDRSLIAAALLVVPPSIIGFAPSDTTDWLLALGGGLALTAFFYLLQRRIRRLGRGQLGREIALGALLQPLAVAALVSILMLGGTLLGWLGAGSQPTAATPTPVLDPLTQGAQPLALAADLVELGLSGLAVFGEWALTVCGFSIVALLFAVLYPPLRNWLQRQS